MPPATEPSVVGVGDGTSTRPSIESEKRSKRAPACTATPAFATPGAAPRVRSALAAARNVTRAGRGGVGAGGALGVPRVGGTITIGTLTTVVTGGSGAG